MSPVNLRPTDSSRSVADSSVLGFEPKVIGSIRTKLNCAPKIRCQLDGSYPIFVTAQTRTWYVGRGEPRPDDVSDNGGSKSQPQRRLEVSYLVDSHGFFCSFRPSSSAPPPTRAVAASHFSSTLSSLCLRLTNPLCLHGHFRCTNDE